jgi:phage terminase large subunit-like protein
MHKIRETYTMLSMGYDPHNAWQTVAKLQDDGFPMAVYRQGYATMSPPTKEFERFVKQKRINHGNNPVLRWMMTNVNPKYDRAENITLHKMTKHQKIDGVIATVIAFGEMLSNPTADSYSSADAFMI